MDQKGEGTVQSTSGNSSFPSRRRCSPHAALSS